MPVFVVGFSKEFNRDRDCWISSRVGDAPVDTACRRETNREVLQSLAVTQPDRRPWTIEVALPILLADIATAFRYDPV